MLIPYLSLPCTILNPWKILHGLCHPNSVFLLSGWWPSYKTYWKVSFSQVMNNPGLLMPRLKQMTLPALPQLLWCTFYLESVTDLPTKLSPLVHVFSCQIFSPVVLYLSLPQLIHFFLLVNSSDLRTLMWCRIGTALSVSQLWIKLSKFYAGVSQHKLTKPPTSSKHSLHDELQPL